MKYFIPEWDDRVDPCYDFQKDSFGLFRTGRYSDVYAHQLFSKKTYDGILVSKHILEENPGRMRQATALKIHKCLRVEDNFPIIGDCGAWSYVNEDEPVWSVPEVASFYERLGFNFGVSVDHMIVKSIQKRDRYGNLFRHILSESDKKNRFNISLDNAEEFYNEHKEKGYSFHPIGSVQGWDIESYASCAHDLIDIGYNYIGIGGVARKTSENILDIVYAIKRIVPKDVKIHVFGISRLSILKDFIEIGIESIDSASHLRTAWARSRFNYMTIEGISYTAIRVPFCDTEDAIQDKINAGIIGLREAKESEQNALSYLRLYGQGKAKINETLDAIMIYDRIFGETRDFEAEYKRTLENRPWEKCSCDICREIGIEVIIFRGNNRNRRRGFHNTWVFYQMLKELERNISKRTLIGIGGT